MKLGLENLLLLSLVKDGFDLSQLSKYKGYSEHLTFALDPDQFDYSKVDLSNYMWQNFIYSLKYRQYFLDHKNELLKDDLEKLFSTDTITEDVRKIVYGFLLEDKELRSYGKG